MSDEKIFSEYEQTRQSYRPSIKGRHKMVVSGHALATLAGMRILDKGGNAVDAAVASGLCLSVLQSDMVSFAGSAPMMIYMAGMDVPVTISGLGPWPKTASVNYFRTHHQGKIPDGVARTVVPGSPDSWIKALIHYGKLSFEEVSHDAVDLAENGFPMHQFLRNALYELREEYARWPSNAEIYLPGGRPPETGEIFYQTDLATTIKKMAASERKTQGQGRRAGLNAARDEFYMGDIAQTIADFYQKNDGLLTREDLASFESTIETPCSITFRDYTIYSPRPWCQGPVLLQMLNILKHFDLQSMGHNSAEYVHTVLEGMKLAFADRHHFYGDPDMVTVPLDGLLSEAYSQERAKQVNLSAACQEMPMSGDPWKYQKECQSERNTPCKRVNPNPVLNDDLDTSYVCAIDQWGNCAAAVPSDMTFSAPVVPGTGLVISTRGSQSWVEDGHPSSVAGGKRPRLTPTPYMIFKNNRPYLILGTPGGDVQCQTILQVFLNIVLFDLEPQHAVESPRFATFSYPNSFYPHDYHPGLIRLEDRFSINTIRTLTMLGHKVEKWPAWAWKSGGACLILFDHDKNIYCGAADPRRESYALGW
ncbi:MAG: gamma-glutamyltransferase family protein [Desulfatirhabdiaceae bacterium]